MAAICQDLYDKHMQLFEDWEECWAETSELRETALMMDVGVLAACGATVAAAPTLIAVVTLVPFLLAGGACGIAAWALADAIDDLQDQYDKCNEIAHKVNASGDKFRECVEDHKNDP